MPKMINETTLTPSPSKMSPVTLLVMRFDGECGRISGCPVGTGGQTAGRRYPQFGQAGALSGHGCRQFGQGGAREDIGSGGGGTDISYLAGTAPPPEIAGADGRRSRRSCAAKNRNPAMQAHWASVKPHTGGGPTRKNSMVKRAMQYKTPCK